MQPWKNLLRKLRLSHFGKSEEGQTLVLAGLAMVVLMMMAGLGIDVGYLRYQKEQMQKATDAGALAAASALIYNGNYVTAATNDTGANGFTPTQVVVNGFCTPSGTSICVAVNTPPLTPGDPFMGVPGYVEVIVEQGRPTFFMPVAGFPLVSVSSRSVASAVANSSGCIYALDSNQLDSQTLLIDSNVTLGAACGMYVESDNPQAFYNLSADSVAASYIGIVGSYYSNGTLSCNSNSPGQPCPGTGIAQFPDPFVNVPAPTVNPVCQMPSGNNYQAGTYCTGINITSPGTYTFGPGVITVMGGINVSSSGVTLNTANGGVLFYLTPTSGGSYQGITIPGTTIVNLTAQTTGPQAGILFFQDRSISPAGAASSSFNGSGGNGFIGAFYFPTTKLKYTGTPVPTVSNSALLVAWQIEFNGSAQLNNKVLPGGLSPLSSARLVE
jgi:hypothetical protein